MVKVLDEISQEIKREEFFLKVKKLLPYIGGLCVFILVGSAFYAWRAHSQEKQLTQDEKTYQEALVHIEKKEWDKAKSLLDGLDSSRGLQFLARMQKARVEKEEFLLTGSKTILNKSEKTSRSIVKIKNFSSPSVENFLTLSRAFLSGVRTPQIDKAMHSLLVPQSPWYPLALSWNALQAYTTGHKNEIASAFSRWSTESYRLEKKNSNSVGPLFWISRCATMGSFLEMKP